MVEQDWRDSSSDNFSCVLFFLGVKMATIPRPKKVQRIVCVQEKIMSGM